MFKLHQIQVSDKLDNSKKVFKATHPGDKLIRYSISGSLKFNHNGISLSKNNDQNKSDNALIYWLPELKN